MPAKISRRLVIDVSIAYASGGEEATFPTSKNCRDFLIAVRALGHRAVMTFAITAEMLKDFHLVEAALATDQTVTSLDDIVRNLFASTSRTAGELRSIVWVNPDKTQEQAIAWLENGAKPEKKRILGFQ